MTLRKLINGITTYYHLLELRLMGVTIGKNPHLCGVIKFQFDNPKDVIIGDNVIMTGGQFINAFGCSRGTCLRVDKGAKLYIGRNCGMSDVTLRIRRGLYIGDYVTIGANVIINDSNSHAINWRYRREERGKNYKEKMEHVISEEIKIEDDVFIGANSIIGKGVTIGARSIVAAGSVVVKSIPSDEVWGGNPAKFIKSLKD